MTVIEGGKSKRASKPVQKERPSERAMREADEEIAQREAEIANYPKTWGGCADLLFKMKERRLAAEKKAGEMRAEEQRLMDYIIKNMPKSDTGAAGRKARVSVITKTVPTVENWDALYAHIKKTGSFELLHKRLTDTAVKERWEAGKTVPGVGTFQRTDVSLTKL